MEKTNLGSSMTIDGKEEGDQKTLASSQNIDEYGAVTLSGFINHVSSNAEYSFFQNRSSGGDTDDDHDNQQESQHDQLLNSFFDDSCYSVFDSFPEDVTSFINLTALRKSAVKASQTQETLSLSSSGVTNYFG